MFKRVSKLVALMSAVAMLLALLPLSAVAGIPRPSATETIAAWDFEASSAVASTASANNAEATIVRESEVTFNYASGYNGSSKGLNTNAWNDASSESPKYYAVTVNAEGYETIAVSAAFRPSNTGPKNVCVQYSIDGATFTTVDGSAVALSGGSWSAAMANIALPTECNGATALTIRFAVTDTTSANGGTIGSGGTLRIDDVSIVGVATGGGTEPEPTAEPTPEPTASITIAEALAAEVGTEGLCVVGTVTLIDGRNVYIQDSTGGIDLYLNSGTVPSALALGDSVMAVGTRAAYKGLPELSGIDGTDTAAFSVLSSGNPLPLEVVTIADLLANPDAYMCERVQIMGATMGAVNTSGSTPLTQGESSINIYRMPANDAVEGDTVNVTAVVSCYNSAQLRVALAADVEVVVPIPDPIDPAEYPDYTLIEEVLAMTETGSVVTVVGQVTYKFGNFGSLNSILLGDVVDNEIIGLQIYDYTNINSYEVGAIVAVTGTVGDYGSVRQLSSVTEVVTLDATVEPMEAQEVTIAEITGDIDSYVSEYVVIKDATLGAYATSGSTTITDATGSLPIYRAAAYPDGVVEGDVVSVYGAASRYNATVQLRNGSSEDYVAETTAYVTIAEALAMETGTTDITVRGVVTFIDGRNVYIQDDTGAIDLYLNSGTVPETLAMGDMVQATGTRAVYKGLPELSGIDGTNAEVFSVLSSGNALPLETVTIAQILATPDAYMCERVKIEGGVLGTVDTSGSTPLTQGESSINIYRIPETDFVEGDCVDVTAIVSCYNSAQLRVADATCIREHVTFTDPIPDDSEHFTDGVLTIPQVLALADSTECTFIGQLVYRFGNYDSNNSAIFEDIISGEIVGIQAYNSFDDYEIGDVLKITATKSTYGGVPQVQSVTAVEVLYNTEAIAAQPYANFSELLADKANLLSEYVIVYDVTLGAYNDNGTTYVTDANGTQIGIYRAVPYTAYGVAEGEVVDLAAALSRYGSTDQLRGGEYYGENKAPTITLPTFLDAEVGIDYTVAINVFDDYGIDTVVMTYTIGGVATEITMVYNETNTKYQAVIPGAEIVSGAAEIAVAFTATDTHGAVSTAEGAIVVVDLPQIVEVAPAPNSATFEDKHPVVSVTFANAGEAPTVEITVEGVEGVTAVEGEVATFSYTDDLADGKYNASVTITRADEATVTYTWSFTVGEPVYEFYFGQLHSHTAEYSDGTGTLEDVYSYVMALPESENVDFIAITDHSNYFDTSSNLGNFDDVESGTQADNGHSKWYNYTTTIDSFNERQDRVIFIGGFEMTWSGQYGHINTFNSVGFASRQNSTYTVQGGAGLVAYYDMIKNYPETIHQFNHPGTTFGNFDNFGYYDAGADQLITMIEVGNGEGAVGGSAYWPSYEQYTLALDMGWHVAPTNNQDNHRGKWGNSNTARDVIITDNFTEEGLYEAMRNMTMYATEDKNLEIYYALNDQIMGSIIPDDEENPVEAINIYVSVNDPDGEAIGTVSVVVNGGIVAYSQEVTGSSAVIETTLANDYSYYFIRVDQPDGDIAVTAPVWVGDVSKVGISNVSTDTVIPVKDEAMEFTTSLYNYEDAEFVISTVTYSLTVGQNEAVVLETIENAGTIAVNSELDLLHTFIPYALGAQTFTVTVVGYLGETQMQFAYNYEFEVLDPSELVDIGIDSGHVNFYVSGNYAGSDAAFIELCAQNAVRTNYIQAGELTYDNIKDYRLLVLTVPYNGWQSVGEANLYTAAELEAIAQYAANGGNLIVCSKSDRGNPENEAEQAHNITNGILAAIGTDTTIANGIVVDNEEKANEAYRLYFTEESNYNYTWNGEPVWLLEDVLETTNNSFSCYNGAPVLPGANAIPVIVGYSTTWGANYTADFGGSSSYVPDYENDTVVVPMGEVTVMTLETLPAGGWLITSGVTFFSTFEVQVEVENATTLQNSNYQLVMNIINAVIPEPVITPIAEVNAADEGLKFTVEGYVTSNASGYDQDTAFFDCIYIQDETAGINLFPVAGDFHIGQYVRVTGVTGSYNGERELIVTDIEVVPDVEEFIVEPTELTAAEAMSMDYTGSLIKVHGIVESLGYSSDGTLETIMVNDGTAVARVFIDGYIMSDYVIDVEVGDTVTATGLASITVDTEDPDSGFIPRIRVRNRAEVVVTGIEPPYPAYNDVDGNGLVDLVDALMILRQAMEVASYPEATVALMDVNGDGIVTTVDALLHMRHVLSLA